MAVIALADEGAGDGGLAHDALDLAVGGVIDRDARAVEDRPVALFEIGDAARQRRQGEGIGADEHLAIAIADGERAAAPGADEEVVVAGEEKGEAEGAFEAVQRLADRLLRRQPLIEVARHHDGDGLGIGLGLEAVAELAQLAAQLLEILDDAVVDDGDARRRDGMGVGLVRDAMRRPARMADADRALHRLLLEAGDEVVELALGAAALDLAVDQRRDPRRLIAAVFETAQPVDEERRHLALADDSDDAAHQPCPLFCLASLAAVFSLRIAAARPGFSTCRPRPSARASAATSRVMALPAAI